MAVAKAIDILAEAMKTISGISLTGVIKGLIGIGGSMLILTKGLKAVGKTKVSISAIITIALIIKNVNYSVDSSYSCSKKILNQNPD